MAVTQAFSGTEAISTTEWSLTTDTSYDTADAQTTAGIYQLVLDLSDMIAGDQLQIRLYEKCRSGDTQRVAEQWILTGAQSQPIWISPAVMLVHGWGFTLDALAGTIAVLGSIRAA